MKEIVVNDTNIFIDLCKLRLLDKLFALPFEVHTVDFVIAELTDIAQREEVLSYQSGGKLTIHSFTPEELIKIAELKDGTGGNVSFTDCAAWHYAKVNGYTLITGDGQLRRKALASDVVVKGILYLFEMFVEEDIIAPNDAATKLEKLMRINPRLPHSEIRSRIAALRASAEI